MAVGDDNAAGLDRAARRREQNRNAQKNLRRRKQLAKQAAESEEQKNPASRQSEQSNQEQVHDWSCSLTANDTPWSDFSALNNEAADGVENGLLDSKQWIDPTILQSPALSITSDNTDLAMLDFNVQLGDQPQPVESVVQHYTIDAEQSNESERQQNWREQISRLPSIKGNVQRSRATAPEQARKVGTRPALHDLNTIFIPQVSTARSTRHDRRHSSQTTSTTISSVEPLRLQQATPPDSSHEDNPSHERPQRQGTTCLHLAANNNSEFLVRYFLARGMDPDICDADGMTALHHAVHGGHKDIVDLLVASGADVDAIDDQGKTALHHAVEQKQEDLAVQLIHMGADMQAAVDTPIRRIHRV